MMRVSPSGIALIHRFESCRLEAYMDSANIWTIGWGTTRYFGGSRVKEGDKRTQEEVDRYFAFDLHRFEDEIDMLTVDGLDQVQFDALVSFGYNVGTGQLGYRGSTLRKRVNANPLDPDIRIQFMRWHKAGGKPVYGLWRRRHAEADHYFGVETIEPPFQRGADD